MAQTEEDRWLERIRPTLDTVMRESADGVTLPAGTRDAAAIDAEIRTQALKVKPYLEARERLLRLDAMSRNLAAAVRSQGAKAGSQRAEEFEAENAKLAGIRRDLENELSLLGGEYAAALKWLGVLGTMRRDLT
ncbi:MAG TPA: hypothetical protein VK646_03785 [Actinomycetota bacterium]|nr:hypothetical protein [Actinomycetota bacterium]